MRPARLAALTVLVGLLVACGGTAPKSLRVAAEEDLPHLVLQNGDAGPFDFIDFGSRRQAESTDPNVTSPLIYEVRFYSKDGSDEIAGTICINDDAQIARDIEDAQSALEFVRDSTIEASQDQEVNIEVLAPSGLVDGAFAYHGANRDPLCGPGGPKNAHIYAVFIQRSNVLCFLAVWSALDQGPELAVSLAKIQAERIEDWLSSN